MMRFYRPTIEALLVQALYSREYAGHSLADMAHVLRNHVPAGSRDSQVWVSAKKTAATLKPDDLIRTLFDQLAEDQSMRKESDLIDALVRLLQLPYARNALSGNTLARLRAAILLPSEQGGLLYRLRKRELACASCGTDFHDRESITFCSAEGQIDLFCHRCAHPTAVSCAGCAATADLSSKGITAMSKMLCPTCLLKKQAGETLTPPRGVPVSSMAVIGDQAPTRTPMRGSSLGDATAQRFVISHQGQPGTPVPIFSPQLEDLILADGAGADSEG